MRVTVATDTLGLGGSETYALTLSEQLMRLGHEVTLCAAVLHAGEAVARARGIDVVSLDAYSAPACDGIVAQDAGTAFELARRHPGAPLVFVAHSEEFDEQLPPLLAGLAGAVVVLNDRVERRVRALAARLDVVRLRQPIDVARFRPRSPPPAAPRRLLLLGNNIDGGRMELVRDVARRAGLELVRTGAKGGSTTNPEWAIGAADIVMGYGRCVLEGMASGRPAYVYDHLGGDGWVTPETYPSLEADGFGGRGREGVVDRERLLADLRRYDPEMGIANRDLIVAGHRAEHHAQRIVGLLETIGAARRDGAAPLDELARLVRAHWTAGARIHELERRIRELERGLAEERAARDALTRTRRYRLGSALARPIDRVRLKGRRL